MGPQNSKTNGYAMSVNTASGSTLSYDLNGNMLSDGTNSYSWDAENRMIKITYTGTNNFSTFVYDGLFRNVSIVETTGGSVTSTKQFVWSLKDRSEERDAAGTLGKKFFDRGQMNSAIKYFFLEDHLGSIREMTDNSGSVQADYESDPFGSLKKIVEIVASDFTFADYYSHSRSSTNLTMNRVYLANLGRWLTRDPWGESAIAVNLFGYVGNNPIAFVDPLGLTPQGPSNFPIGTLLSGFWFPTGPYPKAGLAHITANHGPTSPISCTKITPQGKFSAKALAQLTGLIGDTLAYDPIGRPDRSERRHTAPVPGMQSCPVCPDESIGYVYPPGGVGPPVPANGLAVITNSNQVIITAYPIYIPGFTP
ncbi:hypothetical protein BH10CYA1_BH10CYA1_58590 [soil metagenome]